ncbi:MAG: glutathione-dependent formaldehyde-activating protein [Hyphomonadaceae bacterium]|nr:MAG: glutathione-dependent formaldehyde-activating protein [Hyphomonadaceae bacterium]
MVRKGGCQCGQIRFEIVGELGQASICHCRMCQKAYGNFFAPLVSIKAGTLKWTKAEPSRFESSNFVRRGFCEKCGTPLTYESPESTSISISAFDHPENIEPIIQYGVEARLSYLGNLKDWPEHRTSDFFEEAPYLKNMASFQHPDED